MKLNIELTENDLKGLIKDHIESRVNYSIDIKDISILVKSKQNFKSEWEVADFKAEYSNKF